MCPVARRRAIAIHYDDRMFRRRPLGQLVDGDSLETAVFYCRISDPSLLRTLEFYAEDLEMLGRMSPSVHICTTWRELLTAPSGLLWAWWPATAAPAVLYWRLRRRPVVLTGAVDLTNPLESRNKRHLKRMLTRTAARAADLTLAISDYERRDLERLVPSATVATLHPGVDCEYYTPGDHTPTPTVTTIAQINPQSIHRKGVDRLVDAFRTVRATTPDATLTIIGPISPEGQAWIDSLAAAGALDGVTFLGRVDRDVKRRTLASTWLYVQPSRYEGFGLALAEAMASGAVPVASDVGSLPEVVGGAGQVLADLTVEHLARAIAASLSAPPTSDARNAAVHAAERFATTTRGERFREICRQSSPERQ
jgi:glycosyltransferase involved in cell wall biosynthesis